MTDYRVFFYKKVSSGECATEFLYTKKNYSDVLVSVPNSELIDEDTIQDAASFAPISSWQEQESDVRAQRNRLLSECDWVFVNSMESFDEPDHDWLAYRELLRDISEQDGFPCNVVWPARPDDEGWEPPKLSTSQLEKIATLKINAILRNTENAVLPDSKSDVDAWKSYREQIRAIPDQSGYPEEIVWPDKP